MLTVWCGVGLFDVCRCVVEISGPPPPLLITPLYLLNITLTEQQSRRTSGCDFPALQTCNLHPSQTISNFFIYCIKYSKYPHIARSDHRLSSYLQTEFDLFQDLVKIWVAPVPSQAYSLVEVWGRTRPLHRLTLPTSLWRKYDIFTEWCRAVLWN